MVNGKTYMRADLFAELGLDAQWDKSGKIVSLRSIEKNTITIKTVKQNSEDDMIKITLQYPRIEGLEDQAVQDSINSIFEKEAMQARDEVLRNADELKERISVIYIYSLKVPAAGDTNRKHGDGSPASFALK